MKTALFKAPRHIGAGLLYTTVGVGALWIARSYPMGTASEMGPGYFPILVALLLTGVGLISLVIGFTVKGEPVGAIAWRPLLVVTTSVILFALLLHPLGLVVALPVTIIVSAAASPEFRFAWRPVVGALVMSLVCCLIFVELLGVPLPLFGNWLKIS